MLEPHLMANIEHKNVYAGTNETLTLHARDSANAPANLTSKTIAWYVGRSPWRPDCSNAIFSKTGSVVSASAGTFTVDVAPADTQYLNGDFEHMAKTTDGSGNVAVVVQGRFRIRPALQVP
jgi:hypothetical protein